MNKNSEYTKRYKKKHPEKTMQQKKEYYERLRAGRTSGRRWTLEESIAVWEHEIPDRELAEEIDRSVQSIQVKRAKMKAAVDSGEITVQDIYTKGDLITE